MSKAWIEDLWLTEPRETLPDGSKVKIPVPSSVTKSLAAYMKTPEKAKVPGKFKTARYGHGKRWRVSWWATLSDGSKKRSSKAFSTRADAESFAAAMEDDIRSGRYVDPADADRPFQAVALEWLASKNNLRGRSYLRYENDMTRYVLPKWGDRPIGSIQESEVSEWVHELQSGTAPHEFKRKTTMQPMKRRTIKGVVKDAFGGVMAYASSPKRRWILSNPAADVELPQDAETDDRVFLSHQQVADIAEAAAQVDVKNPMVSKLLILFLAYTGLRANEALALRIGDLDFTRMRISVTKTITADRQGREIEGKPKSGRNRIVPIPGFLTADLEQVCDGRTDDDYLFTALHGGMIHLNTWRTRVWYPAKEGAGYGDVKGLRIHSLRHTYASFAIGAGCDVKTLQSIMGHASATETLNTYAELWPDRIDEVAAVMEAKYQQWEAQRRE